MNHAVRSHLAAAWTAIRPAPEDPVIDWPASPKSFAAQFERLCEAAGAKPRRVAGDLTDPPPYTSSIRGRPAHLSQPALPRHRGVGAGARGPRRQRGAFPPLRFAGVPAGGGDDHVPAAGGVHRAGLAAAMSRRGLTGRRADRGRDDEPPPVRLTATVGGRDDDRAAVRRGGWTSSLSLRQASVRWPQSILDRQGRGLAGVRLAVGLTAQAARRLRSGRPAEADGLSLRVALRWPRRRRSTSTASPTTTTSPASPALPRRA